MIGFVGMGHLGLVMSAATAAFDHTVVCLTDQAEKLSGGVLPVFEPGLAELIKENGTRQTFTPHLTDLMRCELVYFCYDVYDHNQDQTELLKRISEVIEYLNVDTTFVIVSQVSPGFTRLVKDKYPDRKIFYQMDNLIFGRSLERAGVPEQIVIGCAEQLPWEGDLTHAYEKVIPNEVPVQIESYEVAEFAKIAINCYLAAQVAVTNNLARLVTERADWKAIIPILRGDSRIGTYLKPGLGLGGGHMNRDIQTTIRLSDAVGMVDGNLMRSVAQVNEYASYWVIQVLNTIPHFANVADLVFAAWGLTYKPGTSSIEQSPAMRVISSLEDHTVVVHDPKVKIAQLVSCDDAAQSVYNADCLMVLTPWEEYADIDMAAVYEKMKDKVLIDPYRLFNAAEMRAIGFEYYAIGEYDAAS